MDEQNVIVPVTKEENNSKILAMSGMIATFCDRAFPPEDESLVVSALMDLAIFNMYEMGIPRDEVHASVDHTFAMMDAIKAGVGLEATSDAEAAA